MATRQELLADVRAAAEGGPYVVEEKPYGFDLTIDIVDAQWYSLIRKNGLHKVFTYEVKVDEDNQKYSITDVAYDVRWSGGAHTDGPPTLEAAKSVQRGRVYSKQLRFEVGVDAKTHELGTPVNYSFSSGEGRELIRRAAKNSGWSEKMGGEQKGALIVAGVTLALLLVWGVVALVMWLL